VVDVVRTHKVGFFDICDEYNRLMSLLGTVGSIQDQKGRKLYYPNTALAKTAIEGILDWMDPTTEYPVVSTVEEWHIWSMTMYAQPVYLHSATIIIVGRNTIAWDSYLNDTKVLLDPSLAAGDDTYMVERPRIQRDGSIAIGC
jgi:hypothetical protein